MNIYSGFFKLEKTKSGLFWDAVYNEWMNVCKSNLRNVEWVRMLLLRLTFRWCAGGQSLRDVLHRLRDAVHSRYFHCPSATQISPVLHQSSASLLDLLLHLSHLAPASARMPGTHSNRYQCCLFVQYLINCLMQGLNCLGWRALESNLLSCSSKPLKGKCWTNVLWGLVYTFWVQCIWYFWT